MDKLTPKIILVTGSNGLLGQKLVDQLQENHPELQVWGSSKNSNRNPNLPANRFIQTDLFDQAAIQQMLEHLDPSHIIHCAAISSVEACENDPKTCQAINVEATRCLANWCAKNNRHLCFISTDFVFDGKTQTPYEETAPCAPCNRYGASKLDAEEQLRLSNCRYAVLRTILVYGVIADKKRSNLVLWAKGQLEAGNKINVVSDQWRMPTWVDDLSRATIQASLTQAKGIYHISGAQRMSILEAVQQVAEYYHLDKTLITPILAEDIGQGENRPRSTAFNLEKAKKDLNYQPTPFIETLGHINKQIKTLWH